MQVRATGRSMPNVPSRMLGRVYPGMTCGFAIGDSFGDPTRIRRFGGKAAEDYRLVGGRLRGIAICFRGLANPTLGRSR